jgi:hypothetical protein
MLGNVIHWSWPRLCTEAPMCFVLFIALVRPATAQRQPSVTVALGQSSSAAGKELAGSLACSVPLGRALVASMRVFSSSTFKAFAAGPSLDVRLSRGSFALEGGGVLSYISVRGPVRRAGQIALGTHFAASWSVTKRVTVGASVIYPNFHSLFRGAFLFVRLARSNGTSSGIK